MTHHVLLGVLFILYLYVFSLLQDPVIFSGTIRSNLDPFNAVDSDDQIWAALRRAGMEDYVKSLEGGLKASIKEGGSNLSVGQRQLLCMARALLRASRILVLVSDWLESVDIVDIYSAFCYVDPVPNSPSVHFLGRHAFLSW